MLSPEDTEGIRTGVYAMIREMDAALRDMQKRLAACQEHLYFPETAFDDVHRREVVLLMARAWGEAWSLERERFVAHPMPWGENWRYPDIYTSAPSLDRAEVERALTWWLGILGYPDVCFRWKAARGAVSTPVSFEHAA